MADGRVIFYLNHDEEDFPLPAIPTKLNRTNYHLWQWHATLALKAAGKFGYVNGKIKEPAATDPTHSAWVSTNASVLLWLLNTLADPTEIFYRFETAAELWVELEKTYGRPNPARIIDLRTQIFTIHQGDLSVSSYHTKFQGLWVEYCFYRPIPECSCDCEAVTALKRYREEERLVCFLNGLNERFGTVRSLLLAKDPLPSVLDALRNVGMMESLMEARGREGRDAARERLFCSFCNKDNHVVENCFKLKNRRRN